MIFNGKTMTANMLFEPATEYDVDLGDHSLTAAELILKESGGKNSVSAYITGQQLDENGKKVVCVEVCGGNNESVLLQGLTDGINDGDAVTKRQLDRASVELVDKLCPVFTESGAVVTCVPVGGYPLTVTAEEGASQITQFGKNLFNISKIEPTHITESQHASAGEIAEVGADYFAIKTYEGYEGNGFVTTSLYFREVCPSVRVGDTIILNAITDSTQKMFYLTQAGIPIYFGRAIEVTEVMLNSLLVIYGLENLHNKQGVGVCITKNIQVEFGNTATAYELYKEAETFAIGEQIPAVKGTNVFRADVGNITVSGRADLAAKVEQLENAILALGANV